MTVPVIGRWWEITAPLAGGAVAGYVRGDGTPSGANTGGTAAAIGSAFLDALAPRSFGVLDGDLGNAFVLAPVLLGLIV